MDKKFGFQLIGLVIIILAASFLAFNHEYLVPITSQFAKNNRPAPVASSALKPLTIVDPNGSERAVLNIELADNDAKRGKGLGFRESLATDSGMLFIHEPTGRYTYWMKGMQFPIDIIWIRDDEIVDIQPNIQVPIAGQDDNTLERYSSTVDINKVLETNAGFVAEKGIQKGDKIIFD